jgi:hypothetical protein
VSILQRAARPQHIPEQQPQRFGWRNDRDEERKPTLSQRERAIRQRLRDDLAHYAARCLKIRTKAGKIEPLLFNRMQKHLHSRIKVHAHQNAGRVRVLILKARQQGCSTYVGARFYHKATHARGQQVFILTHEQDATDNLFDMAVRFHEHCPELVKPHTGAANAKELVFDRLDSGYSVGTAGSKAVGRSKTLQLFLGSEVAHWPNARDHFAGVMQAVPDLPGTEVILESTGHGVGGEFHERWQQAEAGIGDYEAIFVPWFWSDEYRREVPPGLVLDDEELECMQCTAWSSIKWSGGGPRSTSSRIWRCSSRNTPPQRPRLSSSPAMTASLSLTKSCVLAKRHVRASVRW